MTGVGFAANEGAHSAAARVSHDHDMFDAQTDHPEFKRRGGAVQIIVRPVGRHEIGYVAYNKEFSRFRVEDDLRRYARITASDQHDPGFLSSLGQMTKTVLVERETPAKERFVTADEPLRQQRAAPLGAVCSRGRPRHSPRPKNRK